MNVTAQHSQQYVDVCLMAYGDAAELFGLAVALNVAITDAPESSEVMNVPDLEVLPAAAALAALFSSNGNYPSSADMAPTAGLISGSVALALQPVKLPGVEIVEGQCLVDLCMEYMGDALGLWPLALHGNKSITELLQAGNRMELPTQATTALQRKIIKLLAEPYNKPASQLDIDGPPLTEKAEGIDYWYLYEYVVQ